VLRFNYHCLHYCYYWYLLKLLKFYMLNPCLCKIAKLSALLQLLSLWYVVWGQAHSQNVHKESSIHNDTHYLYFLYMALQVAEWSVHSTTSCGLDSLCSIFCPPVTSQRPVLTPYPLVLLQSIPTFSVFSEDGHFLVLLFPSSPTHPICLQAKVDFDFLSFSILNQLLFR